MDRMIDKILAELELLFSDISFSGIRNLQPVTLQKLEVIKAKMNELSMAEGVALIDDFIDTFNDWRENKKPVNEVIDRLCVIDFYQKTVSGNSN